MILALALLCLSAASLFIGVIDLTPSHLITGGAEQLEILLISRLPRLLTILCTGVGMSVAGLMMQQLCMNKFVSPTTGATISSAQFGILLALLFMPGSTLWGRALFAFGAALAGTWIFVWFIQRIPFKDAVMVPLVGIMFNNVISGMTSYLAYKYEMTQALSSWLVGHFSMVLRGRYEIVYLTVPLVILAFLFANHFNIVGMGRDFSENLGVPYHLILFLGLTISAMITASIVVVVGSISYIGLIVPNVISMIKGDRIRGTLIDTALFGAVFVLACDMIGRSVIAPYELPIELIVGIVGSILFIAIIFYRLKYGKKSVVFKPLLDAITLGKDQAVNLGIDYDRCIRRLLLGVALFIAVATAMVGPVSFLGLILANLSRQLLKTYRHSQLILGSVFFGIIILVGGQLIVEQVFTYTVPVSVFITFFGGIYFLYLLLTERRRRGL